MKRILETFVVITFVSLIYYFKCLYLLIVALKLFATWEFFPAFLSSADFFKIKFFEKFFQEHDQNVD